MNGLTFLIIIAAMGYMIWNWQNERSKLTRQRLEKESVQANKVVMTTEQQERSNYLGALNLHVRIAQRRATEAGWKKAFRGQMIPKEYFHPNAEKDLKRSLPTTQEEWHALFKP